MANNEFLITLQLSHLLATDIGINGDEATIIDAIYWSKTVVTDKALHKTIAELFHVDIEQVDNIIGIKKSRRRTVICKKMFVG